ncbi:protein grpe [Leptolyngbya sp. Heron Island J]|uniref:nucleotide exchange factor GrpE n=1 Tax=Leptolyngbya sp. Heron Island J TaxID=1385935 RepID=UPI0003B9F4EE|nr:nucleotide exchange factor GrpE [Leptolyngbya sp. Heron Island J]ESA35338.1 protein grpe [Leptolyngbya sp. Heron Island J]
MSQSPRDRIAQRRQLQKQQSQIFLELLPVLDDLDRACNHWQQAQQQQQQQPADSSNWWRRLFPWTTQPTPDHPGELNAVVKSAYDGVSLIRQSLLDILERQAVTPIDTLGYPFDPSQMNAMGREASPEAPPNTVIKEILKGYRWQDRVLREAQVIVAEATDHQSSSS